MTVPVLTAVTDAVWEADLVSAFEHQDFGVVVIRRCVDLADLLAAAAAGTARAVIVSADLRRLDRDALARLATAGVAVIGLVAQGGVPGTSEDAERRLRQLGVRHVLAADAGPALISAEVTTAIADGVATGGLDPLRLGYAEPRAALLTYRRWHPCQVRTSKRSMSREGSLRCGGRPARLAAPRWRSSSRRRRLGSAAPVYWRTPIATAG